jgi:hypothetical protein
MTPQYMPLSLFCVLATTFEITSQLFCEKSPRQVKASQFSHQAHFWPFLCYPYGQEAT